MAGKARWNKIAKENGRCGRCGKDHVKQRKEIKECQDSLCPCYDIGLEDRKEN